MTLEERVKPIYDQLLLDMANATLRPEGPAPNEFLWKGLLEALYIGRLHHDESDK